MYKKYKKTENKEFIDLQNSLKAIYRMFDCYKKPSANLTCLDFGPSKEESEIFTKFKLYELPYEFMSKLEFYDEPWDGWGNCQEVKYFLPRLFECMIFYWISNEEVPKNCFFNKSINYKLKNLDNWTQAQRKVIIEFSEKLFLCFIKYGNLDFVDEVFDFYFSINDEILFCKNVLWKLPKECREQAFCSIFNEWVNIEVYENPPKYFIRHNLEFENKKTLILNEALKDNNLLLELKFLYQEPWDNLILQEIIH